jgi:hypothetical protein
MSAPLETNDDLLPLIDVSGSDESAAAARVYKACTESGFFYGEGVPFARLAKMNASTHHQLQVHWHVFILAHSDCI